MVQHPAHATLQVTSTSVQSGELGTSEGHAVVQAVRGGHVTDWPAVERILYDIIYKQASGKGTCANDLVASSWTCLQQLLHA